MTAHVEPRWSANTPPAEKALYERICRAVGPNTIVLPQVMLSVGKNGRMEEAEADLVLIDPDHGVVVVEVKGGTLSYDAKQVAWRRSEGGGRIIRDPVQQVKRARSVIRDHLRQSHFPINEIPLRWVVATPDCTLESPGPSILPTDRLWDARTLDDLGTAIAQAQGHLVLGEQAIGQVRADAIATALRGRSVQGTTSGLAAVTEHETRIRVLTESHRNVLHQFIAQPKVLVRGAAGTGKTMLALEVATMLASQGQRVLLTCWHRLLADHLRRRLAAMLSDIGSPVATEVTDQPDGKVVVADLASLVVDRGPAPADGDLRTWYYDVLPSRLGQSDVLGEFDAIVLDEAQDPSDLWLLALAGLLADNGRWYAFADRQQDLFGSNAAILREFIDVDHELRENFRNSIQIADFAAQFGDVETDCLTGRGPDLRFERVPGDRVVGRLPEIARKLVRDEGFQPADVAAIWLYHNPWQGDPEGLIAQDLNGGLVTSNSAAFKGLERRVIVLGLDVRRDRGLEDMRRSIYAAATRARSQLVVVGDPAQLRDHGLYQLAAQFPKEHRTDAAQA